MESVRWYWRRLLSMSAGELAWRARSTARDVVDRCRFPLGLVPSSDSVLAGVPEPAAEPGFRVSDLAVGEWAAAPAGSQEAAWRDRLRAQADRIARHRVRIFDIEECDLGAPIDWNRDHASGIAAPLVFAPSIDYRDFRVTGDAKVVWEPNRHQHLVVLGRAYRATGDPAYAAAVVEQLDSWLRQCPFGVGMNWRSPLELAVRVINWVWAVDLIRESGRVGGEFRRRLLHALYLHLWEITRKYSRGSSANNHLIGEAAGVHVAACYFPELGDDVERWREQSRAILTREIDAQSYEDGGSREQALGYQLFVLEFFLIAGLATRGAGADFPTAYWARLERMLGFVAALAEGGLPAPAFGDCDDGYVLDLGSTHGDVPGLLASGAVLFERPDFATLAGGDREPVRWLLGRHGVARFRALAAQAASPPLASRALPASGHYLLQSGRQGSADAVSVLFDCAELGFGPIAAHGHADALSIHLRAFGVDVLVDPGTYDYFSFPEWRDYFRSTRAHNTVVVDGQDQSVMLGPFLWGARARARCVEWQPRPDGGLVVGEHDGYRRLPDPVVHRRTVELAGQPPVVTIRDEIAAAAAHDVRLYFHLAEHCRVALAGPGCLEIEAGGGTLVLELDPALAVELLEGSRSPLGGWVSRGYHWKAASVTVVAAAPCRGPASFVSRIRIGPYRRAGQSTSCMVAKPLAWRSPAPTT